jgi:RNA polymerase sigma-70 factor (ECF subfamily)
MATPFPVDRSKDEVWAWLEPHFRQHRRQLYLFALGVLGNREDAEDATQIVLLNAHGALARGERPTWPRAWLFAIALNVCRRLRRQASARHALVASTRELLRFQRGSDAPTGAEISQALSSLPPGQRKIFLLRELRGLTYGELSERLGLSLAATESLLARARRRLREELSASDESRRVRPPRRPLLGIPGAGAALRLAHAPAPFKLAGLAATMAVAPALMVGLHAAPERSQPPGLQAAALPVVQPTQWFQRTLPRPAEHVSRSAAPMAVPHAPMARLARRRPPGTRPVGVRVLGPARADPATVVASTTAAGPETSVADAASRPLSPASDLSSRVSARPPSKPSNPTGPLPIVEDTADEAVDDTLAAVDVLATAVPASAVPPDAQDAVPQGVVPDPPVVTDVLDVTSSAALGALP